jgi:hypothetical protein
MLQVAAAAAAGSAELTLFCQLSMTQDAELLSVVLLPSS